MSERFEAWFKALEEGDGSLALPTPADRKQWDEYVARHALALGAWNAAINEVALDLEIEIAYNEIHIERIEALKSALNDILDNDGSRRIYSAGRLFDARLEAEALLASIEDVDGFDTSKQ